MRTIPIQKRLWDLVEKKEDGCWLLNRKINTNGYARVHFRSKWSLAHRVAWILTNGEIPMGMNILHRCDQRTCVNPEHLFLGTQRDNIRDMYAKGRWSRRQPAGVP